MNRLLLISFGLLSLNFVNKTYAQTKKDSIEVTVTPFASLRGHLAVYEKEAELQENITRVGGSVNIKKGNFTFIAATELHLNLFEGGASFNVDGNNTNEFLDIETVQNHRTFNNRLGYIGFDLNKYGTFTFGKQWSVYYDVTGYTDFFYVFGGTASATYVGGTDGGASGTGRASQSAIYRNKIGDFHVGAQAQMRGGNNGKFIDGYGFSAQYNFLNDFFIGASFNKVFLNKELIDQKKIIGLDGEPTYFAGGFKYQGKNLYISTVGVIQRNGDFAQGSFTNAENQIIQPTVVFNAKGLELYANYNFDEIGIYGGYNYYKPEVKNLVTENNQDPISPKFEISTAIVGFTYQPMKFITVYGEQRFAFGKTAMNLKTPNVFALGLRIDVSKSFSSKIPISSN